MRLLKTVIAMIALPLLLTACGKGINFDSQVQLEGTIGGLSVGSDPATGPNATLGYKHTRMTINSNQAEGSDGSVTPLSATYGNATDARSMYTFKNATASSGVGDGVVVGGGDGALFGAAAYIFACNNPNSTNAANIDCMKAYE